METCEVLIAGAGPTGLVLACDLLASGVRVRVVDKAPGPATTSRALALQPRGVEVLDRAGALGDLEQRSNPIRQVIVDVGGRTTARLAGLGQTTKLITRPHLLVSQADIERGLRRRLGELGGAVGWGREVLTAGQDGDGVTVGLTGGCTARCDWMVGCDGAHSIHRRLAERFRQGRMLIAGDAAHVHSPLGGQGMNTGLGDAENLAWKVALVVNGHADPALLDSYQAERRPIATEVLHSTSAMTGMVVGNTRLARVLRDHVFVPALNHPLVQRLIWEQASQLKVSYRRGPLARTSGLPLRTAPRPGDRVPDLTCLRPDGSSTRLHSELGSRWVLLTPRTATAQDCANLARERLGADTVTVLTPTSGRLEHVVLVRPDAHAGWRGQPSPTALDTWLTGMLQHGRVSNPNSRTIARRVNRALTTGAVGS